MEVKRVQISRNAIFNTLKKERNMNKKVTEKNQGDFIGQKVKDIRDSGLEIDHYRISEDQKSGVETWNFMVCIGKKDRTFLGFVRGLQFTSINSAEARLNKKKVLTDINRQVLTDAINDYRRLEGKSDIEKLVASVRALMKEEKFAEAQAEIAKLELLQTGTNN